MKKKLLLAFLGICLLPLTSCTDVSSSSVITNTAHSGNGSANSTEKSVKVSSIKLSADKNSLVEGESLQVKAEVLPENATDKSLSFASSDQKIATVDQNGLVKAITAGEVTITAKSLDGSNKEGKLVLTVTKKIVLIDSITLSTEGSVTDIEEGSRVKLVTSYTPSNPDNPNINITSSDEKIAKVIKVDEDYFVEGVKEGHVTITAESEDAGDATATLDIKVSKKTILVSNIELTADKKELYVGESTTVTAKITPEDATDKSIVLSSSNPEVATIEQTGAIHALKAGNTTIKASSNDGNATASIDITVLDKDIDYLRDILKTSSELEIEQSSSGTYQVNNDNYSWTTYSDDCTQIDYENDGALTSQSLYYREGNSLYGLTLSKGLETSVSKDLIGVLDDGITEEQIEAYIHSFSLNNVCTVSTIALNYLTSSYFINHDITYSNSSTSDKSEYKGATAYNDLSLKEHHENSYVITTDNSGRLLSFELKVLVYDENGYDFTTDTLKENAQPTSDSITVTSTIKYEDRIADDENKLHESDFIATDFEIVTDTSAWHPNNTLYVGDKVPVEVRVLEPNPHLPMTFTIDEETGIENQGIVQLSNLNGIYYLQAMKAGQTKLTVTNQYGNERSITINVTEIPPESVGIRAGSLTELEEGKSADYYVEVSPYSVVDKSFTAEFKEEEMSQYAEISVDLENSKFTLTAKEVENDQTVTVVVKSTVDPSVQDEITVTIKNIESSGASLDEFKNTIVGNHYNYSSLNDLYFTSLTEGYIKLYKGNTYTFNWDIEEVEGFTNYRLVFSNVVQTVTVANGYTFTGNDSPYYEQYPQERFSNTISKDGKIANVFYNNGSEDISSAFKLK